MKNIKKILLQYWEEHPLRTILMLAFSWLLLAVLFSKGYGMHDDHFIVIEVAQSWADGYDYNKWLPWSNPDATPSGHSMLYVGLHYLFFAFTNFIGFTNPQGKMYVIRLFHALFSLLTIVYAFKIAYKVSNLKTAKNVGLVLALLWFVPFLSVRNLVEIVCIPFLMYGTWRIIAYSESKVKNFYFYFILTGIVLGFAINIRLQSVLFVGGLVLAVIFQRKWKQAIFLTLGVTIALLLIQGIVDFCLWGYPFAEFFEYVRYNLAHSNEYILLNWYNYLLLIFGMLLPPISVFIIFGFFRSWKKHILLFLPTFIFFAFHSYLPSKQERFIFPVIPFFVMLGLIGWNDYIIKSEFWNKRLKTLKVCWIIFWSINIILLPVISTTYSKKSRVEAMVYLSKFGDRKHFIIEDTNNDNVKVVPLYYAKHWTNPLAASSVYNTDSIKRDLKELPYYKYPNYILFCGDIKLKERVEKFKKLFPDIIYLTAIDPGFIDKLLFKMNPVNKNQQIFIYKIHHKFEDKLRICNEVLAQK